MSYDYVDIGTCDFEVADGVFCKDKNYLLVEPMEEYLNRLPSGEKVLLENIFHLDPSTEEISQEAVCPFLDKEVWVSAQGRFNPCCAPDELRQTLGEFGNLKEKRLMDIWTGPTYKKLTKTYLTNNLCRTCNMRRPLSNHLEDSI